MLPVKSNKETRGWLSLNVSLFERNAGIHRPFPAVPGNDASRCSLTKAKGSQRQRGQRRGKWREADIKLARKPR